jgi:hypothetical protein
MITARRPPPSPARGPGGTHLYIVQSRITGALKIGRSDNPPRRLRQLQVGCPYTLRLILRGENLGREEHRVHDAMRAHRTRWAEGEWFHESGIGDIPIDVWGHTLEWYREDPDWWKRG